MTPRLSLWLLVAWMALACRSEPAREPLPEPDREVVAARGGSEGGRAAPRVARSKPAPEESRPLRRGFTQRPPRDAPGLPPLPEPFLSDADRIASATLEAVTAADRERAESELLTLIAEIETASAVDLAGLLGRLSRRAREHAREGRLQHMSADAMYDVFVYPNDVEQANVRYLGRPVVLTGRVAPHNMTDPADGFKLFEQSAYSHEPVLLETEEELVFVRCSLVRPELQKLRDWQEIHLLGVVAGKDRGDVVLERAVVLSP